MINKIENDLNLNKDEKKIKKDKIEENKKSYASSWKKFNLHLNNL